LRYLAEVAVVRRTGTLEVVPAITADSGGATVRGVGWGALADRWGLRDAGAAGVA
jgi:hypothetical protein